jgi:DNA-binding XRE family transcriptional regulator
MADRPAIGLKIKRARERLRMKQADLGAAVGVSQKTIDNWEHDRSYPKSSIGAVEEVLGVNLSDGSGVDTYEDPDEAAIWAMARFTHAEKTALVAALRRERGA